MHFLVNKKHLLGFVIWGFMHFYYVPHSSTFYRHTSVKQKKRTEEVQSLPSAERLGFITKGWTFVSDWHTQALWTSNGWDFLIRGDDT